MILFVFTLVIKNIAFSLQKLFSLVIFVLSAQAIQNTHSYEIFLPYHVTSMQNHSTNVSIGLGSVRLGENQIAEVLFNDQWVPICGHYFWDNDFGSNLFCQEKGFKSGKVAHRIPLKSDGLKIGICNNGDTFLGCSEAKDNKMEVGGAIKGSNCASGQTAGTVINCKGENFLNYDFEWLESFL